MKNNYHTYYVVDLCNLYKDFETNVAYLVVGDTFDLNESESRKIRIVPNRIICENYYKEDEVRVVLINKKTGTYEILVIQRKGKEYDLYGFLKKKGFKLKSFEHDEWIEHRGWYHYNKEYMFVYDSYIFLKSDGIDGYKQTIIPVISNFDNIDISLKNVKVYNTECNIPQVFLQIL